MPIGPRTAAACSKRAGDAEVDQPRRGAHDDVARFDVEVHHAFGGEVVQRGGDVQRQRQHLLERERTVARDQLVERRTFQVLEQQVREGAVGHDSEGAHEDRVREPLRAAPPRGRGRAARAGRSRSRGAGPWPRASRAGARPRPASPRSGARRRSAAARSCPGRARRPRRSPTSAAPAPTAERARPWCRSFVVQAERELGAQRADWMVGRVQRETKPSGAPSASTTAAANAVRMRGRVRCSANESSSARARKAWASGDGHGACRRLVHSPFALVDNPVLRDVNSVHVEASAHPAILLRQPW